MSHLLLSTLIASSLHTGLSPPFALLFLVLSSTPRAALELGTAPLPLSPARSPAAADGDWRGCGAMAVAAPSPHNTLTVHAQLRLR